LECGNAIYRRYNENYNILNKSNIFLEGAELREKVVETNNVS